MILMAWNVAFFSGWQTPKKSKKINEKVNLLNMLWNFCAI
jgi:hypothetical protein